MPSSFGEAFVCWPNGWKVEAWPVRMPECEYDPDHGRSAIHYTNGSGPAWDWRSVATPARAFPGWTVVFRHEMGLSLVAPEGLASGDLQAALES